MLCKLLFTLCFVELLVSISTRKVRWREEGLVTSHGIAQNCGVLCSLWHRHNPNLQSRDRSAANDFEKALTVSGGGHPASLWPVLVSDDSAAGSSQQAMGESETLAPN